MVNWAFLGQFPVTVTAFIVVYFVLDLPKSEDSHWIEKLRRIDFLGACSLVLAVTALLVGLDRGSNVAWSDKITIISTSIALPHFAIFLFIEIKIASHPFAPGHVIFDRGLFASYLTNFLILTSFMGLTFYCPLYFQAVSGMSATQAGLRFIPAMLCSVSGSLFGGVFMKKTGKYFWLTICCLITGAIGNVVISLFSGLAFDSSWGIVAGLCLCSFGGGAAITTTLISVIANVDPKEQAIATACTYLFRSLGSVVGVSLSAAVVQQSLRTHLRASLDSGHDADDIVEKVRQSLDYIKTLEPATRVIVVRCYQMATNMSFGIGFGVIILALVRSCFIREKKLSN